MVAVPLSYAFSFTRHLDHFPASSSYWNSPFWGGVDPHVAKAITPLQAGAALGFLWLLRESYEGRLPGVLSKPRSRNLVFLTFLLSAALWAPLTFLSLQRRGSCVLPVISLLVTFVAALQLLVGAFGSNSGVSVWAAFFLVGVTAGDAFGWSSSFCHFVSQYPV